MCILLRILITFCSVQFNLCLGSSDCHYSLSSVYELFDLEIDRLNVIETYIENEHKRLDDIRRFIEQRKIKNEIELETSYTESSTNAFKTILRVKTDWETLKNKMAPATTIENLKPISITDDNINSAFKAIRRLQIIFALDSNILASGNIEDFEFEKLDANDCNKMASLCYDNVEYHCAKTWYDEVYAKYNETENGELQFDKNTFLTKYIWSSYLVGDIDKAKEIFEKSFSSDYESDDIIATIHYTVWAGHEVFKRNTADDPDKKFYSHSLTDLNVNEEVGVFISACNQDIYSVANYLKCRYYHGGNKFLKIAPLRQEVVSIVPDIKLYHNVLFENEIKKIKEVAKPKLEKLSTDTNEDISLRKVAVFGKQNDTVFDVIHNRLVQLSLKSDADVSNKYVVTNYGLAGHYLPHPRYIDNDHLINSVGRQAIIVFHMDDVPGGGCTVLPDADVIVPSIKGSALVVYNTRNLVTPYGIAYEDTQYGSCPIFYGDKWTLTGWFEDNKFSYHDD